MSFRVVWGWKGEVKFIEPIEVINKPCPLPTWTWLVPEKYTAYTKFSAFGLTWWVALKLRYKMLLKAPPFELTDLAEVPASKPCGAWGLCLVKWEGNWEDWGLKAPPELGKRCRIQTLDGAPP